MCFIYRYLKLVTDVLWGTMNTEGFRPIQEFSVVRTKAALFWFRSIFLNNCGLENQVHIESIAVFQLWI